MQSLNALDPDVVPCFGGAMKSYAAKGTGVSAVSALHFTLPVTYAPARVTFRRGSLLAPPSANQIAVPPPGAWRNFADTDPKDRGQIQAIARRFGTLTEAGSTDGESLERWQALI